MLIQFKTYRTWNRIRNEQKLLEEKNTWETNTSRIIRVSKAFKQETRMKHMLYKLLVLQTRKG